MSGKLAESRLFQRGGLRWPQITQPLRSAPTLVLIKATLVRVYWLLGAALFVRGIATGALEVLLYSGALLQGPWRLLASSRGEDLSPGPVTITKRCWKSCSACCVVLSSVTP